MLKERTDVYADELNEEGIDAAFMLKEGFIVCYGFWFIERRVVDDVVGAIPLHGFNGTWGLIALGLFADGTYGNYTTAEPFVTGLFYGTSTTDESNTYE